MTLPRRVTKGRTYLLTRRTVRRYHLFRPDKLTNQIYLYCLAVAANEFGMDIHLPTLMSTHEHLGCTDPLGNLSLFLEKFHRNVANAMKVHRKWEGAVWDDRPTNALELLTPEAVVEEFAYAIVNPVKEGLVKHEHEWPGVTVRASEIGNKVLRIERPDIYFNPDNPVWPDVVELELTVPPGFEQDEFHRRMNEEVRSQRAEALKEVRAKGWRILGRERVLSQSPYKRAKSFFEYGGRTPTLAVGRGQGNLLKQAIKELRFFRLLYRDALRRYRGGAKDVAFPEGTWWMRVFYGLKVEPIPI